jgi:hypothetical protein
MSRCEWLEVPPAASTGIPWFRPMPAKYLQSLGIISSGMRSLRSLVLKTQWMRMLGYLWAIGPIFAFRYGMSVPDVTLNGCRHEGTCALSTGSGSECTGPSAERLRKCGLECTDRVPQARHGKARHGGAGSDVVRGPSLEETAPLMGARRNAMNRVRDKCSQDTVERQRALLGGVPSPSGLGASLLS